MVANEETFDEASLAESNNKEQYKEMKRKLRLLVYVSTFKYHFIIVNKFIYFMFFVCIIF